MKCPKCGGENNNDAKFCKNCGETLASKSKNEDKNKKIIIGLIAVIAILLAGVLLTTMGAFGPNIELETQEFDGFRLDVPVDSEFVLSESYTTNPKSIFVGYINNGKHTPEAFAFQVGTNVSEKNIKAFAELAESDGDLKVYKNESDGYTFYQVFKKGDDANIDIFGDDLDTIKRMANSFEDQDFKKLASTSTKPKTTSTQTSSQSSSSTPSSMSILGGSFSTGSAEEDKTYASINVGTAHAGEDVIVQIWYSRDGNTLNNGNMVPATVHSDGYLEIASADAYHYYPDHATINIYDSNSKLLTTQSVSLSPESGTQTF